MNHQNHLLNKKETLVKFYLTLEICFFDNLIFINSEEKYLHIPIPPS